MGNSDKIHIALAFCDPKGTYCQHAAVTIASVFANTKSQVCFHVLHDDTLTDENRQKMQQLAAKFSQEIEFINVGNILDEGKIRPLNLGVQGAGPRGALFRFSLPYVTDLDKIIYFDCDIVCQLDIAELWNIDLQGKSIAAVPDNHALNYKETGKKVSHPREIKLWDFLGIHYEKYFNSGVMVMDLKKLREENFMQRVEDAYATFRECFVYNDQDCLNYLFTDDMVVLPEKFNHVRFKNVSKEELPGQVWHFATLKPWEEYLRPNIDELYWKYIQLTPWCNGADELVTVMIKTISTSSALKHEHTSDCVKRIKRQMSDNIFRAHCWMPLYIFIAKCRMKFSGKGK